MKTIHTSVVLLLSLLASSFAQANQPNDSLIVQFGNRTRLIIYSTDPKGIQSLRQYDLNKLVQELGMKLDSLPNGQTRIVDERNGSRYLQDTLLVVTRKNGQVSVSGRINENQSSGRNNSWEKRPKRFSSDKSKFFLDFNLGLNTLVTNTAVASYPTDQYTLKPLGSRYFSITTGHRVTLSQGARARFDLYYGLELAWNNYMFENTVKPDKGVTQVNFVPITEPINITKLTVSTLNLPLMPRLTLYNESNRRVFRLGIGGFVGYRLDSYSKIAYKTDEVVRDHSSYFLNDFQYGLVGQIGILRTDFFIKYNLNPTFQSGKGPDLRSLSFGLTI